MTGHKRAFTLLEMVIVIGVMAVLNGIGILFLVRHLEVQHQVSARTQLAVQSHLLMRHLRDDVSLAERAGSGFQGIRAASDCLILESGQASGRQIVVYRAENGGLRRREYQQKGPEYRLLSDRGVLGAGRSVSFRRDPGLPRVLWVEIEGPPPDRSTSRDFRERAALYLPCASEEPRP